MVYTPQFLELDRCPWCITAKPSLHRVHHSDTNNSPEYWAIYECSRCRKIVLAYFFDNGDTVALEYYPDNAPHINEHIPERARLLLKQAQDTIQSPDASIMVCASALDIMLQEIGRNKSEGNLAARIKKAAEENQITKGMADWAHEVRMVANDNRHPDLSQPSATIENASLCLEFALALAEILFVLPARVKKGIAEAKSTVARKIP